MSRTRDFTQFDSRKEASERPAKRAFPKSWGAEYLSDGEALFRLWAPDIERLRLQVDGRNREMLPAGAGWFTLVVEDVEPGTPYRFVMPDGQAFADPASRAQEGGVDGPSIVLDPSSYRWSAPGWRGHAWEEAILYEIHIGTFTPEGTFRAAAERLNQLASLGVTMLQVMPVNQFPGERGWGYDGVLPYAPHHAYGTPDDMKAFVDAAHRHGLSVMLDVVYNHFGPRGSLLQPYVPSFFDPERKTPWGPAIDFSRPQVRRFFIDNALYWLEEYDLDGLRLDAVDQIVDDSSEKHFLVELAERVHGEVTGRRRHLVMEDHRNITRYLERNRAGEALLYEAVWNHDVHHAAHVAATGETAGYVGIFADDPVRKFARGLAEGFIHQGEPSPDGEAHGEPSGHLPPTAFINFLQNHDQVGNRAFGERLISLTDPRMLRVMTAILLLSPQVPLLFMGEDYGETQGFRFFSDYQGVLARETWDNRINEAANFGGIPEGVSRPEDIADPNLVDTFERSKLRWEHVRRPEGRAFRGRFRELIAKRREHVVPGLRSAPPRSGEMLDAEPGVIAVDWRLADRILQLRANLSEQEKSIPPVSGSIFHAEPMGTTAETVLPGLSMVMAVSVL
ncbi:malto-oligosyltrehalose trehalohydrolase [Neorhizobium sp. CSC1952]|uniref:malto-oligosyltrehalose trehalohydrolase n=1 Tax=Neorhizobium sp. CSC1952 TaxID=2978974 RepID=UPI0025A5E8CC|nr:malto-oligosyltrehalose trehalohydrolase [Rhizobium sp. CSC1952]WJR65360.1 malto-oligosyltrehalose trehalohydrolase [Rhizobium sp. CSC1952]